MAGPRTVLLLDGFDVSMEPLARRLRALELHTLCVATAPEAVAQLEPGTVDAVVLPADLPSREAAVLIPELRARAGPAWLGLLAAGPEPRGEARDALREAGIGLALWEPFDAAFLRYQLNRALASRAGRAPRCALRVPCSIPARARAGEAGREKPGRLYTLSERGLFFETARAVAPGRSVALELRIAGQTVAAEGRVTLANLAGERHNPKLPVGIGVRFTRISPPGLHAIRHAVAAVAAGLDV